ncbi:MAG TPA: hypothetical protein VM328_08235 [Fimbriimonadaceae bacterium]|nr:hypothetical protein [Fimbriimonadaceae bacterium]
MDTTRIVFVTSMLAGLVLAGCGGSGSQEATGFGGADSRLRATGRLDGVSQWDANSGRPFFDLRLDEQHGFTASAPVVRVRTDSNTTYRTSDGSHMSEWAFFNQIDRVQSVQVNGGRYDGSANAISANQLILVGRISDSGINGTATRVEPQNSRFWMRVSDQYNVNLASGTEVMVVTNWQTLYFTNTNVSMLDEHFYASLASGSRVSANGFYNPSTRIFTATLVRFEPRR